MAYVNLYKPNEDLWLLKSVRLGLYTYTLGFIYKSNFGSPYLIKTDNNGMLVWQRRYQFTGSDSGNIWNRAHFTDIIETSTEELILLVTDRNNALIVKLDSEGNVIWKKKYYDRRDTPTTYDNLNATPRLFQLNSTTAILYIFESSGSNDGIERVDILFYSIDLEHGTIIATKQIESPNGTLSIRDLEVRLQELIIFGYDGGPSVIIKINAALIITQSVSLSYNGSLPGFNYPHIYNVSQIYNGNYAVLGSFYQYDPNTMDAPSNVFFIAELNAANTNVISANITDRVFAYNTMTIHKNTEGIAFSIGAKLIKLNSNLTASLWVKTIEGEEFENPLVINKSIGNTFDAYSDRSLFGKFAIASTSLDFVSCKTKNIAETINLSPLQLSISNTSIPSIPYTPYIYDDNIDFTLVSMAQTSDTKLCPSSLPKPDLSKSTIVANPISIQANGTSTSLITVTLKDAQDIIINPSSYTVAINTTAGTWAGPAISTGNGTYTRTLISATSQQTAAISFNVIGFGISPNTASVNFTPVPYLSLSTIVASPTFIQANGTSTSLITVTLKDAEGITINPSDYTVQINPTAGTWLGPIVTNGNGVYTRTLISTTTPQTSVLSFSIPDIGTSPNTASVRFSAKPDLNLSTITASPASILANGTSTSLITVTLKDAQGITINPSNYVVQINPTAGTWSGPIITNGNGTYTRTLISTTSQQTAILSFSVTDFGTSPNTASVIFTAVPDLNLSTIVANPTSIQANGISTSLITVTLKDAQGIIINPSNYTVQINKTAGAWSGPVISNGNGTYTITLVSSTSLQTSIISFSVTGYGTSTNTATVNFIEPGIPINFIDITALQSPYLYLQSAGSDGSDSTPGRHLRWALKGILGERHLPKGNFASNHVNFNKPQDYVRIYKAAYIKKTFTLNLLTEIPDVVDNTNCLWIYRFSDIEFYIRFGNTTKYNLVKQNTNPLTNPSQFISNYGGELIELENIKKLFFAASPTFAAVSASAQFKAETLSVDSNALTNNKFVSNRTTLLGEKLNTPITFSMENGRSIRWIIAGAQLVSLDFEFYDETIAEINFATGWMDLGQFALTNQQSLAYERLEPVGTPSIVNGRWHRFNETALINTENYKHKWDGTPETGDRNILEVVKKYIELSEDVNNPFAEEKIPLGNNASDPEDHLEISNLDMLNFSANDYHIARMLGLGVLDLQGDGSQKWLYAAEYFTHADLQDGEGIRDVQHLYMSLPTSNSDFRLPIPLDLDRITPGVFIGGENGQSGSLTDEQGYTDDGTSRYVSLYTDPVNDEPYDVPFFISNVELNSSNATSSVYGGLKYKLNNGEWRKPELSNDSRYVNYTPAGVTPFYETRYILIPEPQQAYYVHRQTASGLHSYKSYGINWFSRAKVSDTQKDITTTLKQKNPLLPPSNRNALLIRPESPLLLTSQMEQNRLNAISGDKTLIRLTYDYHSFQDLKNYNVPLDSPYTNADILNPVNANNPLVLFPDNEEIYATEIDIFFRNSVPNNVRGRAISINNDNSNEMLSVITTGIYQIVSTGEKLIPYIAPGTEANYIGGMFVSGEQQYVIHSISSGSSGPVFKVYKKEVSDSIVSNSIPSENTAMELKAPILASDGIFMAIENMQNTTSWGTPNPLTFKVKVGTGSWPIHREIIQSIDDDGQIQRMIEKTRGIWGNAEIVLEPQANQPGTYKITFNNAILNQHPQYNDSNVSAEWYQGTVRIFTQQSLVPGTSIYNKTRKVLPVIKIENIGTSNNLVLYVQDPSYSPDSTYDYIITGSNVEVNFYPGYKIYLYQNSPYHIDESHILPAENEGLHYSIFGFRSRDNDTITGGYTSKISPPCLMYAQELVAALPPEQPEGALFATRPDFFGRSTYTLTTKYKHKPHAVLFYRSNDEALLNALYEKQTIKGIRESLMLLGGNNEEYLTNRWTNFLDFTQLTADGDFKTYPPIEIEPNGYKFPNPDKQAFFDWANKILEKLGQPLITDIPGDLNVGNSKIIGFVKGAIYNSFVALSKMPIIYEHINGIDYQPVDKAQVIKNRNGNILDPESNDFDMAPMMKIMGTTPHQTLFTDFKLDGTSNNLYFYGVKELSTQMKMSDFSPFLGPIKLVNTNAPETPEIKRIIPVLENIPLNISPYIQLEINAFPKVQNIKKISIYRSNTLLDAQSVQTMQLVKVIDLETEGILNDPIWTVTDNFDDLVEMPFSLSLFYRITVSREIQYADAENNFIIEYAPSQASKIVASLIVENNIPQSPILKFQSTIPENRQVSSVTLEWTKTAYNAKYHVYKMTDRGGWKKIYLFQTNDNTIVLPLEDTQLQSDILQLDDGQGNTIYHHFKVITENTAGMLSVKENILTIYSKVDGIGVMIIEDTFEIK